MWEQRRELISRYYKYDPCNNGLYTLHYSSSREQVALKREFQKFNTMLPIFNNPIEAHFGVVNTQMKVKRYKAYWNIEFYNEDDIGTSPRVWETNTIFGSKFLTFCRYVSINTTVAYVQENALWIPLNSGYLHQLGLFHGTFTEECVLKPHIRRKLARKTFVIFLHFQFFRRRNVSWNV